MSAHTPGPWEEIPQHGAGPMIAHKYATGKQMNPIGLRLVCHILMRGNSMDEDQANARLIAAAPELYAACEAAIAYDDAIAACGNDPRQMSSFCTAQGDTLDSLYEDWIRKSTAALARARGES